MSVVVQKYGGTSVGDVERIKRVADRVAGTCATGKQVVVVVSAMGQTTDELVGLAQQVTDQPPPREMDMLLTAGERVSMSLLAMALDVRGVGAVSYTGSQAGILTDSIHGEARITEITGERVKESLDQGRVVIVAGFQGVDPLRKEITTLGRGGSDTTAVALAATLRADFCEINTDVAGVHACDPRVIPSAPPLAEIGYHEMFEMASAGAGVLMPHCVEFAHQHAVPVHVRSSFGDEPGTWVTATAPAYSVAGLAARLVGDVGRLTVVGGDARDAARLLVAELEGARLIEDRPFATSIAVEPSRVDDSLRTGFDLLSPPVAAVEVVA